MGKIKKEVKSPKVKKTPKKSIEKSTVQKKELKKKIDTIKKTANAKDIKSETSFKYENFNIDLDQVRKGVEVLLEYNDKQKSDDLFKEQLQIFLQITSIRVPVGTNRKWRIKLKHPLITVDNEICLVVKDLKRGRKVDHEETIEHYENLLKTKNVKFIKRIIPIRQLRVEYDQYELKRRLCGYYDYFLVDGRISGHVLHLLGKIFTEKRKQPVPIQVTANDLNATINQAMSKTELNVHGNGDSYVVQVGKTDMPIDHIVDNLKTIIRHVSTAFPGGWKNIRSLHIKTDKSIAIPVYYTLRTANEVKPPVEKKSKANDVVTDEITTSDFPVTVYPDGRIHDHNPKILSKKKQIELKKSKKKTTRTKKTKLTKNGAVVKKTKQKKTKVKVTSNKSPAAVKSKTVTVKKEPATVAVKSDSVTVTKTEPVVVKTEKSVKKSKKPVEIVEKATIKIEKTSPKNGQKIKSEKVKKSIKKEQK